MAPTFSTTAHGLRVLPGANLIADIDAGFSALGDDTDAYLGAAAGGAVQEGVIDAGFEVTQASGGASMVLDISSNVGTGCYVQDDSTARRALYYVPSTGSKTSVTATTAHATLPRVDAVVVSLAGVVSVVAGTATSGATLDNARDGSHGGAVIPSSALHLADVLVPATDTTLSNNQIRDRRKWARGAHFYTHVYGGTYTAPGSYALIDSANLQPRIECSGAPLRVTYVANLILNGASAVAQIELMLDGVDLATERQHRQYGIPPSGSVYNFPLREVFEFTPAAGSHLIGPAWQGSTASLQTGASSTGFGQTLIIEEVLRQTTANNVTTSG